MEIVYDLNFRDVLKASFYRVFRSPLFLIFILGGISFVSVKQWNIVMALDTSFIASMIVFVVLTFILLTFLGVSISVTIFLLIGVMYLGKYEGLFTTHKIQLIQDMFVHETSRRKSEYNWSEIKSIGQSRNYILLNVSRTCLYHIPKRAFASPQAAEEFYQNAYGLWQAAKE